VHEPLPPVGDALATLSTRRSQPGARPGAPTAGAAARARRGPLSPVVVPLVVVGVPLVLLVVGQFLSAHHAGTVRSDFAVIEMATRRAATLDQSLGPYSRFGWNHPGPFLYYWNLPFWSLTDRQPGGLALAAAVLGATCLLGVVAAAHRVAGRLGAWAAVAGVLAFFARYGTVYLRQPWNPPMAAAPTALAIVLAVALASGRPRALPWFVAAASIAFQLHVGTGPTVAAVGVTAAVLGGLARRDRRAWRGPLLATLVVVAGFWTVPFVQQAGDGGNMTAVADYLGDDDREPQDRRLATRAVVQFAAGIDGDLPDRTGAGITDRPISAPSSVEVVIAIALVAALAIGAADGARRGDRRAVAWGVVPVVALAAAVYSAVSVDDELHLYLLAFVAGTSVAAWIAVGVLVSEAVRRAYRAGGAALGGHRWWQAAPGVVRATVAAAVAVATVGRRQLGRLAGPLRRGPGLDDGRRPARAPPGPH
jgi:hypothetical protein